MEDATSAAHPATSHVLTVLAVTELERAVTFYTDALGWKILVHVPVYAELETHGRQRVGLYQRGGFALSAGAQAPRPEGDAVSGAELYLRTDDLAASISALTAAGARPISARAHRSWGDEVAYFSDPDGHVIAVAGPHGPEDQDG